MQQFIAPSRSFVLGAILATGMAAMASAEPKHGIAMFGEPDLPADFTALPYANPDAPRGGKMTTAEVGTYDSLNPYITKGKTSWQLRFLMAESLMGRSLDEPFSLYGILAESIETGPNREWVEFVLRPEAKFSDGTPVTPDDVIWSFETLGTVGHPRYHGLYGKIESIEKTGDRSVKFTFNEENAELALLAGMRPILQKAQWEGIDFEESGTENIPVHSGPYIISSFEDGRFIEFTRRDDYWGDGVVPFMNGQANIDTLRIEFFGDETAAFEAFKIGDTDFTREFNVGRWETQYAFPRVQSGEVVKEEVAHERPSGMTGLTMNTRREPFDDWRVREAMIQAFNFEFINEALNDGAPPRITSFYSNSPLGMSAGPAEGAVLELLEPYADTLPPGAIEGYSLPVSDGSERNREGIAKAISLMEEAGYTLKEGVMTGPDGEPVSFEILLDPGNSEFNSIADIYVGALKRMGVEASVNRIDSAQFKERTDAYDFDMTYYRRALSLSPGNEQYLYFGSEFVDTPGGRNLMGANDPAIDAMIDAILAAPTQEDFRSAVKAYDRVLMSQRYVIPTYQWNVSRIAYEKEYKHPERIPIFGDWTGWQPDVWWFEEE